MHIHTFGVLRHVKNILYVNKAHIWMLVYCKLDSYKHISGKFESKCENYY